MQPYSQKVALQSCRPIVTKIGCLCRIKLLKLKTLQQTLYFYIKTLEMT